MVVSYQPRDLLLYDKFASTSWTPTTTATCIIQAGAGGRVT
jgi:hypothetical protein